MLLQDIQKGACHYGHHFWCKSRRICGLIGLNGAGKGVRQLKRSLGNTPFSGRVEVEASYSRKPRVTVNRLRSFQPSSCWGLTFREHIEFNGSLLIKWTKRQWLITMELVEAFPLNETIGLVPAYFQKGWSKSTHRQRINARCACLWSMNHFGLDPLKFVLASSLEKKK